MKTTRLLASLAVLAVSLFAVDLVAGHEMAAGLFLTLNLLAYGQRNHAAFSMADTPRLDALVGSNEQNVGAWFGADFVSIDIPTFAVTTATAPADVATINLPPGLGRFIVLGYTLTAITAAGTLVAGLIGIRDTAGGAGALLVTATALTGVTAVNLGVTTNMALTAQIVNAATVTQLFIRQTVDSGNAGTVAGRILIQPVR